MRSLLIALLTVVLSAPALAQPATNTAPSMPELSGEGVFSTSLYELTPTFTPDGQTAYTTISTPNYGDFFVTTFALLAVANQVRRAAQIDPATAMRGE